MRINHNIAALNTHRQLNSAAAGQSKSMEKLSSGLRINRAGDDAAGLAISEKMRGQIRGLDMAAKNSQDAISLIQTAEGALNETHSILQRMRELATYAANDTNTETDRNEIQKEINQLTSEINRIGNTTEFNTQKLINGEKDNTLVRQSDSISGTISGMSASLASNATLKAGDYTLEVTKESRIITTEALMTSPDLKATISGGGFDFAGGGITVAATSGDAMIDGTSGSKIEIARTSGNTITVTITNAGASGITATDVITANASGKFVYSNHGVEFTINGLDDTANGEKVTIDLNGHSAQKTYGVNQQGWTSLSVDATDSGAKSPSFASGKITVNTANEDVQKGTWTGTINTSGNKLTLSFVGADGKTTFDDEVQLTSGKFTYAEHGISFEIDMTDVKLKSAAEFKFDIKEDYTLKGTLKDSDGNAVSGATNVTLVSGYDGVKASGTTITGIGGINLSQTGQLKEGTFNLEVEENYTGEDKSLNFQIGANQNQSLNLSIADMRSEALGISSSDTKTLTFTHNGKQETVNLTQTKDVTDGTNAAGAEYALDVSTSENASKAITVLNNAIERVSAERSKLGANQNRLEHTINNLNTSSENLTAAESRIRDVDMAKEMMEQTKNSILSQAAQAMLAQANQQPQGVLQLLR
ncbi:flagellin [Lysinibacillus endophyticus]|uniref:flagellin N-terminal helical domain-containing protein n=1 Tax=Ureibacillus endophyticus TaxID=1978490 RepID=UPI0026468A25|nr:flagellin [Lysinibacillus endophyticus]